LDTHPRSNYRTNCGWSQRITRTSLHLTTLTTYDHSIESHRHQNPQPLHKQQLYFKMSTTETNNDDDVENNVRLQKQLLRKEIRLKLKLLTNEEIEQQSRSVWDQLHAMKIYQEAKSIGLFLSMPTGEIKTSYAVQHAIQCQKDIYIPQVGKNFELPDMDLIQIQTSSSPSADPSLPIYENWPKNKWNIPEPPVDVILKTAAPGDIDLLVIPGLAFDRNGNRLGQGKGYYDRFMARMCSDSSGTSSPVLVAVALQCQFIGDNDEGASKERTIPVHEHDFPVNWIILPDQFIEIAK
jgi:5-formyltetrahydrofolate cyclo-ligase